MKKRNWLMTIAFAVLSLTIISTCVIGSTYAKFTSQVSGGGKAQAAGFLVAGKEVEAGATVELVAPETTAKSEAKINYFSQVVTEITVTGEGDMTGTGVFAKWTELVAAYKETDAGKADTAVTTTTALKDVFKVSIDKDEAETETDLAIIFAKKVAAASGGKVTATGAQLSAMGKDETTAFEVTFNVTVTWTSLSDTFDTFIGNNIYENLTTAQFGAEIGKSLINVTLPITASQVVA